MLDLGLLQAVRPVLVVAGEAEGVEGAAGVAALLGVELRVAEDLDPEHQRLGQGAVPWRYISVEMW